MEEEMSRMLKQPGCITRIIGPNCVGVQCPSASLNCSFTTQICAPGNLGLISQSGAMLCSMLDWAVQYNVGFGQFVSVGSMMDVNWAEIIDYMAHSEIIKAILIYMETVGDARAFLSAAREVNPRKPIIVLKPGRTQAAAAAAVSHTGSLTGSDDMLDAAFKRAGVLRVDTIDELFQAAQTLSTQPLPKGPRMCIVTNAGGPGVMATDALIRYGGQLAKLSEKTMATLNSFLPPHWSHANPVDLIGSATAETYAQALDTVLADEGVDAVQVIFVPVAVLNPGGVAQAVKGVCLGSKKPILCSCIGGEEMLGARSMLCRGGVPTFPFSDAASRFFCYMWEFQQRMNDLYTVPRPMGIADAQAVQVHQTSEALIQQAYAAGRLVLTETESKRVLAAYGIPTVETVVCATVAEAQAAATRMGFPVVVKLNSETITHKSDVGGVMLNIENEAQVARAWEQILANVTAKKGAEHFQGVAVQAQISSKSYELLLGATCDAQLGPVIVFGYGGKMVEVMKDTSLALPPLNTHLAENTILGTKISKVLKGYRGEPAVNQDKLVDILCRFSRLLTENPRIKECDINPLMAYADRVIAVDARVVLYPAETPIEKIPIPAIRGYPINRISTVQLKDSTACMIRPIRGDDVPAAQAFFAGVSAQAAMGFLKEECAPTCPCFFRDLCFADYDRNYTLVMTSGQEIIGIARMDMLPCSGHRVQASVIVKDAFAHKGVATALLSALKTIALAEHIPEILAEIPHEVNHHPVAAFPVAQHLFEKAGFARAPVQASAELLALTYVPH
eukprot:GAFH01000314.1.p1 GENE.GAFH01000314.1~~GAFH01000314.1.p1  ORF type:complete len:909 (-),score=408.74 GAFH01000314.1:147-2516(-)